MAENTSSSEAQSLGAELLAHTLRQVRRTYEELNWSLFRGSLVAPTFQWSEASQVWGCWYGSDRILALNPRLIDRGWGVLTEVLKHEMAHQFVDECEGVNGEGPHGDTFRRVCRDRGIDAAATGEPAATGDTAHSADADLAILRKIEGLLALARSDNQNEAEVAMANARRLMLRYNLTTSGTGRYSFRHIGKPKGRRMAWERALANILSDYFFVSIIIVPVYRPRLKKRGSVLEACGTPTNLEMAAYAHDFLLETAHGLWRVHKRDRGVTSNRDQQSFLYGVMAGFSDKLAKDSARNQREGLVWLGDPELDAYFRRRHPHVRQVGGRGRVQSNAFSEGHAAGTRIVLHRGMSGRPETGAVRLLGSGGRS